MIGFSTPGVYAFYEEGSPMHVGRSDDIRERVQVHGRPGSDLGQAACAATIARMYATIRYRIGKPDTIGLRQKDLHERILKARRECARFRAEYDEGFDNAKVRVSQMCVHFVEIPDAIEQTIFEVYAHVKLGTPYNYDNFLNR